MADSTGSGLKTQGDSTKKGNSLFESASGFLTGGSILDAATDSSSSATSAVAGDVTVTQDSVFNVGMGTVNADSGSYGNLGTLIVLGIGIVLLVAFART